MKSIKPTDIQRQVDDALAAFGGSLGSIEKNMLQEIELLIKGLAIDRNGKIKTTTENIKKVTLISKRLEKIILNKQYLKETGTFISAFRKNSALQDMMYRQNQTPLMKSMEELSIDIAADNLTESGVRANIVNPVKKMLVQSITSGGSYSDLTNNLRETLTPTDGPGIVTKYVKTYALDSINSFSRNYNTIISNEMGYEWFEYTGSLLETSREFCTEMVAKRYYHVSEIPKILKGHINNHKCELSDKTGLPKGMKAETTKDNFHQLAGGWNCGHQIIGVPESTVPKTVRDRLVYEQKEGIKDFKDDNAGNLYFDPTGIKTFTDLATNMAEKVSPIIRKKGFANFLKENEHEISRYHGGNIYSMKGAEYNKTEFHVAEKLAKAGYHVVFPNQTDLGKGRKNDVYLYDAKTYVQRKVELKSLFGDTADTVASQLMSGSGQSSIVAYDIQSGIRKNWLIKGLRAGWTKDTKTVMLNWKGQWYELNKKKLFDDNIYKLLP